MARYADIDKFLHIVPVDELGNTDFITIEKCLTQASADVVPRAELAKEIFADIMELLLNNHIVGYTTENGEWVYYCKNSLVTELDELKKKYE